MSRNYELTGTTSVGASDSGDYIYLDISSREGAMTRAVNGERIVLQKGYTGYLNKTGMYMDEKGNPAHNIKPGYRMYMVLEGYDPLGEKDQDGKLPIKQFYIRFNPDWVGIAPEILNTLAGTLAEDFREDGNLISIRVYKKEGKRFSNVVFYVNGKRLRHFKWDNEASQLTGVPQYNDDIDTWRTFWIDFYKNKVHKLVNGVEYEEETSSSSPAHNELFLKMQNRTKKTIETIEGLEALKEKVPAVVTIYKEAGLKEDQITALLALFDTKLNELEGHNLSFFDLDGKYLEGKKEKEEVEDDLPF